MAATWPHQAALGKRLSRGWYRHVQRKGFTLNLFQKSTKPRMRWLAWATLLESACWMTRRLTMEKKHSTRLSHDAWMGVNTKWKRFP